MDSLILVLYELARRMPPQENSLTVSTSRLGEALGVSQQTASRYLTELERKGLVERTGVQGQTLTLTKEGLEKLKEVRSGLERFFDGSGKFCVKGRLSSGLGEGAYYIKEYTPAIEARLGIKPFPGTLNIGLMDPAELSALEGLELGTIEGFERDGRTFGSIRFAPVKVSLENRPKDGVDCYLIIPARTHHRTVLEIISEFDLRARLGISDGDVLVMELI